MTHQKFAHNPHNNFLALKLRVSSGGTKRPRRILREMFLRLQVLHETTAFYLVAVFCFVFASRILEDLLTRAHYVDRVWIEEFMLTWLRFPVGRYLFSHSLSVLAPLFRSVLSLHISFAVEGIWSTVLDVDSFLTLNSPRQLSTEMWRSCQS